MIRNKRYYIKLFYGGEYSYYVDDNTTTSLAIRMKLLTYRQATKALDRLRGSNPILSGGDLGYILRAIPNSKIFIYELNDASIYRNEDHMICWTYAHYDSSVTYCFYFDD